jgi:peroxiredoxin
LSKEPSNLSISRRAATLLGLLVLALVALNTALIIQNRRLRATASDRSIVLKEGTVVPPISGMDINNNKFALDYGNDPRKTVMLVFSPRCSFCTKNMPNWAAIAKGLDRKSYRIVAVSIFAEGVKEYVGEHKLADVPIIAEVDPKARVSYEMNVTPETILIDSRGKVEKIWTGVLYTDERAEVERLLGLKLPTIDAQARFLPDSDL